MEEQTEQSNVTPEEIDRVMRPLGEEVGPSLRKALEERGLKIVRADKTTSIDNSEYHNTTKHIFSKQSDSSSQMAGSSNTQEHRIKSLELELSKQQAQLDMIKQKCQQSELETEFLNAAVQQFEALKSKSENLKHDSTCNDVLQS